MAISAKQVGELRKRTGAGMMDCKKALVETDGDIEQAIVVLQKKGLSKQAKRAGRIATEGAVGSYIHGGRIGVLVEVNCETDFVGKTDEFQSLVRDVAMQIAAANPIYVDASEVPAPELAQQREIFRDQMVGQGKPDHILDKIVEGKVRKWMTEICLLDQPYIKDTDVKVSEMILGRAAKMGENVRVRRFVRWELGEGLEKRSEDFAAEVAAVAGA